MFLISKIQFELELLDNNAPLGFWGVKLRGGYGESLKQELCDHTHLKMCEDCPRFNSCEFPLLFKPQSTIIPNKITGDPLGKMKNLPPPFIIEPPSDVDWALQKGSRISFCFTAFGVSVQRIIQVIDAFGNLGVRGIKNESKRSHYHFLDARDLLAEGRSLHAVGNLQQPVVRYVSDLVTSISPTKKIEEAVISFVTPVRVLRENFPLLQPDTQRDKKQKPRAIRDFYDFILLLTDRVAGIWQLYGENWIGSAAFHRWQNGLLKDSKAINTKDIELRRQNYTRFSSDQQQPVYMDGFVGEMHIAGDLTPFIELLLLGEIVHIGESTPYGFGQYKIVY